jgi:hypothetical protein
MSQASTPQRLTARATIDLATARTLVTALALLGLDWSPAIFDRSTSTERGLYVWVIGRGTANIDALDRPAAYVGVGCGAGGLRRRLTDETRWISAEAEHLHGRAMHRLACTPVGGPVRATPAPDLRWLDEIQITDEGRLVLRTWLASAEPEPDEKAERLCIRVAGHIGDTPPPLNSQFAGVWDSVAPWDWGGWAVAQHLASAAGQDNLAEPAAEPANP